MRPDALFSQLGALGHAEPVLLIDDREREIRNVHRLLYQRVRTYDDVDHARREQTRQIVAHTLPLPSEQKRDCQLPIQSGDAERLNAASGRLESRAIKQAAYGEEVLFGQNLGRSHERGLAVVVHCREHGGGRHDRLAAAHVALQQAAHRVIRLYVGQNVRDGAGLRSGEIERQRTQKGVNSLRRDTEGQSASCFPPLEAAHEYGQLEHEQLVERQPASRLLVTVPIVGIVHLLDRVSQTDQSGAVQDIFGEEFVYPAKAIVEGTPHQSPQNSL